MGGTIDQQQYSSGAEQRTNLPAIVKNKSLMQSQQKEGLKSRSSNRTNGGLGGMNVGANDSTIGSTAVGHNTLQKNSGIRQSNH